jgi:hypothetical protein
MKGFTSSHNVSYIAKKSLGEAFYRIIYPMGLKNIKNILYLQAPATTGFNNKIFENQGFFFQFYPGWYRSFWI